MSYRHPTLTPFFSRDADNGKRQEILYVLSPEDGVLVTTLHLDTHIRYVCRQVRIPVFPGASPYNYTVEGEPASFGASEDVTDFVDVVGELTMRETFLLPEDGELDYDA